MPEYSDRIEDMIRVIRAYGVSDNNIFEAMRKIPRHLFMPDEYEKISYEDHPVPIGYDQTISQPYTVAMMLEALELKKGLDVLEIGAGSGWNAALIKEMVDDGGVVAIEYVPELVDFAKMNIKKTGLNIEIIHADGSLGYEESKSFDRIIITCACPDIPRPLIDQLKENGIIIAPVGKYLQKMVKARKINNKLKKESLGSFAFVPLKGKYGF